MKKLLFIAFFFGIKQLDAQVCFDGGTNYGTSNGPGNICTADFDGDGRYDLATSEAGTSQTISVLLNIGNGMFGPRNTFGASGSPFGICTADFNNDSKADIAISNYTGSAINVFLGNGNGTFGSVSSFTISSNPQGLTSGDFNNDGKMDIAAANYGANAVTVLMGNGLGGFGTAINYTVGTHPQSLCIADFNGDGYKDIAAANYSSNNISVLIGVTGGGAFAPAINYTLAASSYPSSIASGDFNGDSHPDLVTSNSGGNNVSVLINGGTGSFGTPVNIGVGSQPNGVICADFNKDGKVDLAVANYSSWNIGILLGNGLGFFVSETTFTGNTQEPINPCSGDFNGDGFIDIAVPNANTGANNLSVLLNTLPVALTFSGNTTVCNGSSTILTASGTTSYTWSANAASATTASISVSPTTLTTYTVTGSNTTCSITTTATVSVNVNVTPTVTANTTATVVCVGDPVTLTASGTANTYTWTGGVTDGVAFAPSTTTTYSLTGEGLDGCTHTVSQTIIVNSLPTIAIAASATLVCSNTPVALTESGSAITYTWSTSATTSSISVSPVNTTTYTVAGTDGNGCINIAAKIITTNPLPPVTANSTANTFCTGSGGGIILSGGGANTYTWTGGINDGVAFTPSTTQTYTVTGTDGNGCKNTAAKTIVVSSPPFIFANANNTTLCKGDTLILNGSGALTYTWTNGAIDGVPFFPNTSNVYYVTGTDANGCTNTNSASIGITVNQPPNISIVASATLICPGALVTLLESGGAGSSFLWSTGVTTSSISVTPSVTTTYSLTAIGNSSGCAKTVSKTITVYPLSTINAVANPSVICHIGNPSILTESGSVTSYTWSTGATTHTTAVTPTVTTTYTVTGTDANSCTTATTVVVATPDNLAPEICIVTTDSTTNYQYNIVYWQNTLYPNADSFIVYRYASAGNYLVIGTVPSDSSRFIDANRNIGGPNGGDPSISGWQYTLAVKDNCGNTSPKSPYHFTANFQQNNQNLIWSPYQIQSPQVNPLDGYEVLRDSLGIGDYRIFADVSYLTTSTQDPSYALYPNAQYRVDALGFSCTANERLASGGNNNVYTVRQKSHSNTSRQSASSIKQVAGGNENIVVYPNPASNVIHVGCASITNKTIITVYDALGRVALQQACADGNKEQLIDIQNMQAGLYFIEVEGVRKIVTLTK